MPTQKGFIKTCLIIFLVLFLVFILIVGVGGYLLVTRGKDLALPFVSNLVAESQCKNEDKNVCKYLFSWLTAQEYAVKTTSKIGGMKVETLLETSTGGSSHYETWEGGKETSNMIVIGSTTYIKDYSDNKWWKQTSTDTADEPTSTKDFAPIINNMEKGGEFKDNNTYRFIAKEPCEKLTCFKYQVISEAAGNDVEIFVWFDDKKFLTRKQTTKTPDGSVSESVYTYGKVEIKEPSPVKGGEPGGVNPNNVNVNLQELEKQIQDGNIDDIDWEQFLPN